LFTHGDSRLLKIALLTAIVGLGLLVYASCLWLFGIVRTGDLRTAFRRR
jgi:hypothetical protein